MKPWSALGAVALTACIHDSRPPRPSFAEFVASTDANIGAPVDDPPPLPIPPADPGIAEPPLGRRLVHYSASVTLRVTRVDETLETVTSTAVAHGGLVESLTVDGAVVKVPVAEFAAVWAQIRGLGERASESVVSEDVTDRFSAIDLRIQTLQATRDRLLALLGASRDEAERLALVHELQRVTEELDILDRSRQTLQGLADYSRIAVHAVPLKPVHPLASGPPVAGFAWIQQLSPFDRALGLEEPRIAPPVPEGMVAISRKGRFIAESPEGAVLWTGWQPNDPAGDATFWIDAVQARIGREYASATRSAAGDWECLTLVDQAPPWYTWQVCASASPDDDRLSLAEAFYPTAEAFKKYQAGIAASLAGGGAS
jgi:hypothetical protein